ncbi:hypothetical protein Cni_G28832 [Canna indica]|uniref:Endonuclease/exonuclease/phosphatase domain-containing protein n=1 Tax=Canna indica TaxID=4628 RepID=A0AAQ3L4N6_9LILI|nr:hypothetical protein Cni_G28832 [Canna indica]
MDNFFFVPSQGTAGSLILAWKHYFNITIVAFDSFFIQAKITLLDGLPSWHFIGVHLHYDLSTRRSQLLFLSSLIQSSNFPTLIGGDFNAILRAQEKIGGAEFMSHMTEDLQLFINSGSMLEFPTTGPPFTWSNKHASPHHIEKHGISLGPIGIRHTWTSLEVTIVHFFSTLLASGSDDPISNSIKDGLQSLNLKLLLLIPGTWMLLALRNFASTASSNPFEQPFSPGSSQTKLTRHHHDEAALAQRSNITSELKKAIHDEENFWRQRLRIKWLAEGDRNTSFFHANTRIRRSHNSIHRLKIDCGEWVEWSSAVAEVAQLYFQSLFSSSNPPNSDSSFPTPSCRVTSRINSWLLQLVSSDEVKHAAFSLNPDIAPGPDGFTGHFFRHFWYLIGPEVIEAAKTFFRSRKLLQSLNRTEIALIPKTKVF